MRDSVQFDVHCGDSQPSELNSGASSVIVLVGGSVTKRRLFESHLKALGCSEIGIIHLSPQSVTTAKSPKSPFPWDPCAAVLSVSERFRILGIVPLVDSAVGFCDMLCQRMGIAGNDPQTSLHRTDKEEMQRACRAAGLRNIESVRISSLHEAISVWQTRFGSGEVVIKPPRSGGCDGVAVCATMVDVSTHVRQQLHKLNLEKHRNTELVVQEYMCMNSEFVINTVSSGGRHFVTDVWRSAPKRSGDSFIYDYQELVQDTERLGNIFDYTKKILDAVGVRHGACHVEVAASIDTNGCVQDVVLIEVNARIAGEIRTSNLISGWDRGDQIFWLLVSLLFPPRLEKLNSLSHTPVATIAVFLRNLAFAQAALNQSCLEEIRRLASFSKFGRGLSWANSGANEGFRIGRTVDLVSSPGVVLLSGPTAAADARQVRLIEANSLYLSTL